MYVGGGWGEGCFKSKTIIVSKDHSPQFKKIIIIKIKKLDEFYIYKWPRKTINNDNGSQYR